MEIGLRSNSRIRRIVIPIMKFLTRNIVYTIQFGSIKIKRKGGLDFLGFLNRNLAEERFLSSLDLKGKIVYDIGAYNGVTTSFFGKLVRDTGRVIAFEPNPDNFSELKKSIELNDLHNVKILNIGIADTTGNTTLAVRYAATGTSSMDPAIQTQILSEKYARLLHTCVDTVDHCIITNNLPPPDFIKMDIEGLEYNALRGAELTIKRYSPKMYIEIHGADKNLKIANINRIMEFLHLRGYEVFHVESEQVVTPETAELAFEGHIFCKTRKAN